MLRRIHEYVTLLGRNFRVLLADHFSLVMTLLLAPFIAIFVMLAFWLISNDTHTNDNRVFAAQIFFDTLKLASEEENYKEADPSPGLFSYPAENAAAAMEAFQEDYILYNWLYPEVADRGEERRGRYSDKVEDIWRDESNDLRFIPDFVLFRYNLPRMLSEDENERPYKWPESDRITPPPEIKNEMLTRRAEAARDLKKKINGEESTRSHMTVFFILIAAAIWMGLLPACKEIVAEWDVFLRESRSKISSVSFLISKFTMLAIVTAVQDAILVGMVCRLWQGMPWRFCIAFRNFVMSAGAMPTTPGICSSVSGPDQE